MKLVTAEFSVENEYSLFLWLKVTEEDSYIQGCAFHNGFSPAVGVFGTEGLHVDDNIVHHTVGEGKHKVNMT